MKSNKEQLCQECFGAKDIYNGEEYETCVTCKGKGVATKSQNEIFLDSIRMVEEES